MEFSCYRVEKQGTPRGNAVGIVERGVGGGWPGKRRGCRAAGQQPAGCNQRTEDSSGPGKGAHGVGIGLKMGVTATSARDGTNSGVATAQQINYRAEIQGRNIIQVLVYIYFTDFATGSVNILINVLCVLT